MKKTIKLFERYFKLLNEQEPGQDPSAPAPEQPEQDAPPAQPETEADKVPSNEKYIIKLLTNAFIFNPKIFDKTKQNLIASKIKKIHGFVNVPISTVINEIKSVLAMDNSLKVESRTNMLLRNLFNIMEEVADATEPQPDSASGVQAPAQEPSTEKQSENKLSLEEIFPLYKELLLKALRHIPTEEELMILKPVANQFSEVDPLKIVEAIQNLLSQSLEDKEVKDNLSNA